MSHSKIKKKQRQDVKSKSMEIRDKARAETQSQLNNFTVYTATSARGCLAIYSGLKDPIDMVLMDGAIAGDQGVEIIITSEG